MHGGDVRSAGEEEEEKRKHCRGSNFELASSLSHRHLMAQREDLCLSLRKETLERQRLHQEREMLQWKLQTSGE